MRFFSKSKRWQLRGRERSKEKYFLELEMEEELAEN